MILVKVFIMFMCEILYVWFLLNICIMICVVFVFQYMIIGKLC